MLSGRLGGGQRPGPPPQPWSSLRVLGLPGRPAWPTQGAPGALSPLAISGAGRSGWEPPRAGIFPTGPRKKRSGRQTQTSSMRPAGHGGSVRFQPCPSFLVGGDTSVPGARCFEASVGLYLGVLTEVTAAAPPRLGSEAKQARQPFEVGFRSHEGQD